jgi:purine-nucleoside phosphorylase
MWCVCRTRRLRQGLVLSGVGIGCFLFGLYILCLFTVYLCNRLILYGLLGGFKPDQASYF